MKPNPLIPALAGVYAATVAASHLGKWWVAAVGIAVGIVMTVILWIELR